MLTFDPVDAVLIVNACDDCVNVTAPLVLNSTFGVDRLSVPIAPVPEVRFTIVEPVTVPLPDIVPDVVAVNVSVVPATLPLITTPPPFPVANNCNVPVALIIVPAPDVVIAAAGVPVPGA